MAGARLRPGNMVRWAVCRSPGAIVARQRLLAAMLVLAPAATVVDVLRYNRYEYRKRDGALPMSRPCHNRAMSAYCSSEYYSAAWPAGGWVISPDTADSRLVVVWPSRQASSAKWGTDRLAMSSGAMYWTWNYKLYNQIFKASELDSASSRSMSGVVSTCKELVKCVPCDDPTPGCVSESQLDAEILGVSGTGRFISNYRITGMHPSVNIIGCVTHPCSAGT